MLTIDKYDYEERKFASGAFGSIHHGYERDNPKKKVVVKIVGNDTDARQKEAKCQKKLKGHKNIVSLLTSILVDGDDDLGEKLTLVLEYCNGGNLKDFVRKKGGFLRQKSIMEYLLPQLRAGYKAIYDKNIVHRDIKLENIFLSHRETDFPDPDEIIFKVRLCLFQTK